MKKKKKKSLMSQYFPAYFYIFIGRENYELYTYFMNNMRIKLDKEFNLFYINFLVQVCPLKSISKFQFENKSFPKKN